MKRFGSYATVGGAGAIAFGFFAFWLVVSGGIPFTGGDKYKLEAVVPQAASIGPGAGVRIAGVDVGRVESVERVGASARIKLTVDDEHAPLPADTKARVRLRSLVGENFLELDVGRAKKELASGDTLQADATEPYVEVDQILSALRGPTRERAREMFQGLGGALKGRGTDLNKLLESGDDTIADASPILEVLNGQREPVSRIVANLGSLMASVGERGAAIRQTADGAQKTFTALTDADEDLRETLAKFPALLRQVRSTTGTVREVSSGTAPVVRNLATAVSDLRPAIKALRPAAQQGRNLLKTVDASAEPITAVLGDARKAADPIAKALPPLQGAVCQLNPALKYLAPYSNDIGTFLGDLGSVTNYYDGNGHIARLYIIAGLRTPSIYTPEVTKTVEALTNNGLFGEITGKNGYNPYPKPNTVGENKVGIGSTGPRDSPRTYTKIEADC